MLTDELRRLGKAEMTRREFFVFGLLVIASLVGLVGLLEQLQSNAKTPTASIEPESGTLATSAKVVTDTTASNGKAVEFVKKATATGLMVGIDISTNGTTSANTLSAEISRIITNLGITQTTLPLGNHAKFYDSGDGIAAAVKQYNGAGYDGMPLLCHKVDDANAFAARLKNVSSPEVWVYWQEQGANKGPSDADYNTCYLHMDQARQASPNGKYVYLLMDGASAQENQQVDWQNKKPKAANVDYIGLDTYRAASKMGQTPAKLFEDSLNWHNAVKGTYTAYKGVVIPEYGVDVNGSNGKVMADADRKAIIQADITWLNNNGYAWVNYWDENNSNANSDWSVDNFPLCTSYLKGAITRENI